MKTRYIEVRGALRTRFVTKSCSLHIVNVRCLHTFVGYPNF